MSRHGFIRGKLDIKLLMRTFTILFRKESTQGFTQAPDNNNLHLEEMK